MRRGIWLTLLLISSVVGESKQRQLTPLDVRLTMREIFAYHVENKELSAEIMKRTLRLYIEQFDPHKLYLTDEEVAPFLNPSYSLLNEMIDRYFSDDLSVFSNLNKLIVDAIYRNREFRRDIEETLIETGEVESRPSLDTYVKTTRSLKSRLHQYLASRLKVEMSEKQRKNAFTMWERRINRFEKSYVTNSEHIVTLNTLRAMARSLDAHTGYYSPEEAYEIRASLHKEFQGVGILFREEIDGVYVSDLIAGAPAERSHTVASGDILIEVDGVSVESEPYDEVLKRLKGPLHSEVDLKFQRGEQTIAVKLKREKISMDEERVRVTYDRVADGIIAKFEIPAFYDNGRDIALDKDMREALRHLQKVGTIRGMVLDLRENTGGFLTQAVKVSGMFIPNGLIVISKYSNGETRYTRDIDGRKTYEGPLVILTSKMSASASEIVAGALQDYGAALIVGDDRTFGKGSMQYQTITDEKARAFYKVTVGRYYTASGRSPQIEGVHADIVVPTVLSKQRIGERFLQYPLTGDQLEHVNSLGRGNFNSFENPVPYLKMRESSYRKMLPRLKANSEERLLRDKDFQAFLGALEGKASKRLDNFGVLDLQMREAVHIIQDMLLLANNP